MSESFISLSLFSTANRAGQTPAPATLQVKPGPVSARPARCFRLLNADLLRAKSACILQTSDFGRSSG
jgi:hypothetical protein